jgi:3-phytase
MHRWTLRFRWINLPRMSKTSIILLQFLLACSCDAKPPVDEPRIIARTWASSGTTYAETDSLAACRVGTQVRLFATSKHGHRLDVFDAANGKFITSVGTEGADKGQFRRPNGIVSANLKNDPSRPILFVVERDNARVQAIWPDTYKSAGIFGKGILTRPYGAAIAEEHDGLVLYVSDDRVPDHKCIRRFAIVESAGEISANYLGSLGDTSGEGAILKPESLVWDPVMKVLLICDEDKSRKNVKVYGSDGKFRGKLFAGGIVQGDPEGLVIADSSRGGFIILTDQRKDITIWHLFDRRSYQYLTSVTGKPAITNTDGICLFPQAFGPFKKGALFAVDNDADIHAFELDDFIRLAENSKKLP